jgi:hypothetical protein
MPSFTVRTERLIINGSHEEQSSVLSSHSCNRISNENIRFLVSTIITVTLIFELGYKFRHM